MSSLLTLANDPNTPTQIDVNLYLDRTYIENWLQGENIADIFRKLPVTVVMTVAGNGNPSFCTGKTAVPTDLLSWGDCPSMQFEHWLGGCLVVSCKGLAPTYSGSYQMGAVVQFCRSQSSCDSMTDQVQSDMTQLIGTNAIASTAATSAPATTAPPPTTMTPQTSFVAPPPITPQITTTAETNSPQPNNGGSSASSNSNGQGHTTPQTSINLPNNKPTPLLIGIICAIVLVIVGAIGIAVFIGYRNRKRDENAMLSSEVNTQAPKPPAKDDGLPPPPQPANFQQFAQNSIPEMSAYEAAVFAQKQQQQPQPETQPQPQSQPQYMPDNQYYTQQGQFHPQGFMYPVAPQQANAAAQVVYPGYYDQNGMYHYYTPDQLQQMHQMHQIQSPIQ